MITEQQEFQISQYADGSLPDEQRAVVAELLRGDVRLQQLLGEYQNLDRQLNSLRAVPAIHWDRLAEHLSAAVDEQTPATAGRILPAMRAWQLRSAVAAMVMLAVGGVIWMKAIHRTGAVAAPTIKSSDVVGPQAEVAKGPAIEDITVGPSPALAKQNDSWRYADGMVSHGPSKVTITAVANPAPHTDSHLR